MKSFRDAQFIEADFHGAVFRGVDFSEVTITDAWVHNVQISGHVDGLSINGVDVGGYVERTLNERHPERGLLAPTDTAATRVAWNVIEEFCETTLLRARTLPVDRLSES